jgi:Ca2+-transporting ATPase
MQFRRRQTWWVRLAKQFRDPQVVLLVSAAAFSGVVSRAEHQGAVPYEALIILAIVVLNALLGFFQEERAERALASLQQMAPAVATVIREGQRKRVPAQELVPGDLVWLEEGDHVPADARLAEVSSLRAMESTLTGESLPVDKSVEPVSIAASIGDRSNMLFAGTLVVSGNAQAVLTATGMQTEFGRIALLLRAAEDTLTPLQQQLRQLSRQLGIAVLGIAVVVVLVLLSLHGIRDMGTLLSTLLFGIALAVAATPEGLLAVITLVQAIGVRRMARRGAILRTLTAVETLGATTVIASDKTGTLTRNEMTVTALLTAAGRTVFSGAGYAPVGGALAADGGPLPEPQQNEVRALLRAAALANNAQLEERPTGWAIHGDPTEAALLVAAAKVQLDVSALRMQHPRLAETVFSSERRRMSAVHGDVANPAMRTVYAKGALDTLLDRCTGEFAGGSVRPMMEERRSQIRQDNEQMAAEALRILGVAMRPVQPEEGAGTEAMAGERAESGLIFLGMVGMMDPPRPEARAAVEAATRAGIRVLLITGDHAATAIAVARLLGIAVDGGALEGGRLESLVDAELAQVVRSVSVYARVHPEQKLRIVRALQQNGEIVAMTGDGVNDAPALKAAHIGVAMGVAGTDVSREAADLVLTDDNFATIVAAVEEGRILYDNIRKFLQYLLATNMGEVMTLLLSIVALSLQGRGRPSLLLPLTAAQILWVNLVTDGAPALALGVDAASPDIMRRPPGRAGQHIVDRAMVLQLVVTALVMAVGTAAVFFIAVERNGLDYARTLAFTTLILFQLCNAFSVRAGGGSIFRDPFGNRWLWGAVLLSLAMQIVVLVVPFLRGAFGLAPLRLSEWLLCLAVASSTVWISELMQWMRHTAVRR